jgi:hypothetical protein
MVGTTQYLALHKFSLLLFVSAGAVDGLQIWFRNCDVNGVAGRGAGACAG